MIQNRALCPKLLYSCVATFALAANSFAPGLQSASLCVFRDGWSGTRLYRGVTQPTPSESAIEVRLFVFIIYVPVSQTVTHGDR